MIKINLDMLIMQSVQGKIHHPTMSAPPYRITHEGVPLILPATGGITYNVKVGDSAFGWAGDHIEPGVSIRNENTSENGALMTLSCIGNEARVISGEAKGARGFVTGTHGGIEHVLAYFHHEYLEKMAIDDVILIKAYGQGLCIEGFPEIKVMNVDPNMFLKMGITEKDGKLEVPVVAKVPAYLMGSGVGASSSYSGDYDIMTADTAEIERLGLNKLRFGDIVLLEDCDNSYGRGYLKGAVSIGVVIHSDCVKMGHGPGVTTLMTCKKSLIEGKVSGTANITSFLGIK